ncbi:2OG-Fe(II) oxygenase [bacterium]|nr:2OG-Fe(II) oxygenase [bacterium]
MRWPWHKPVRCQTGVLPADQAAALRQSVIDSPWLSDTTLNMRFASTWGFSVAFRRGGLARLRKIFPAFVPYLDVVLEDGYNAFFLNPLVIFRGGQVEAHIDCSLRSYTAPLEPPFPGKVSVYYAQVPDQLQGGQLLLSRGDGKELARVTPVPNMVVQFDGELMHQVTPFQGSDCAELDRSRISLVCEHYRLSDTLLTRVPDFHFESSRQFGEFFDRALEVQGFGDNS